MSQASLSSGSTSNTSILNHVKQGYLVWLKILPHIPKGSRYTLGARIESKFLDLLELTYLAYFTDKEKKIQKITHCLMLLDTLKFLFSTAWEGKLISHAQYEELSLRCEEIGKMLGGWRKSALIPAKKNRTE